MAGMRVYDIATDTFKDVMDLDSDLSDFEKNDAVLEGLSEDKKRQLDHEYAYLVGNGYQGEFWEYVIWDYKRNDNA